MNDKQDFTTGSISKKMIGFMIPVLGALILQAAYSCADMLIVGRFGTTAGISGVSTGCGIVNMATFTVTSIAMGVTILMGRYIGEKNTHKLNEVIGGAIFFFAIAAVVLTFGMIAFARPLAVIMQAPEEALDLTVTYIRICGAGFIFVIAYNVISGIFRGIGNSSLPLIFVAIASVVNVIGDLILVAGFKMNVAGAAIATISAQAISVLLSLLIIRKQKLPFTVKKEFIRPNREIANFVKLGAPLALQEFLTSLTFMALNAFINRLGLDASAGYGVAQRVQQFVMLIPVSIMQSMASFVAQNVGAGKEDRAKKGMFFGMGFGAVIGIFVALGVFFFGDAVSSVFSHDPLVIGRSFEFLRGFALEAVLTSFLFSFMGYFNGHGRSLFVMIQGLLQSLFVRLPMSYFMSIIPNVSLTYIGLATPTATLFGIAICFAYYIIVQKQMKKKPSPLYD
ncbi:MAG: MATE family efflux transporter [Clostridia bacterium]|nr:MATE family efflux transporter [Clostridia bacterium]